MISWQVKQQIIDQTNIVEVVGEVVQLSKKVAVTLDYVHFIMIATPQ